MSKHDKQYINKFQNSNYKVWIHIEEVNDDEDYYQDIGEPVPVGEFENLDDAVYAVADLANARVWWGER